jgi:hypothetical protein
MGLPAKKGWSNLIKTTSLHSEKRQLLTAYILLTEKRARCVEELSLDSKPTYKPNLTVKI